MTKEEAVACLKGIKILGKDIFTRSRYDLDNAVDMAIKALEQEPKAKAFDVLRFVADNAGLSTFEAIEKAYNMGVSEQGPILDKIRAEIKALSPEPTAYDVVDGNPTKDAVWETLADVLKIIDKYNADMRGTEK